MPVLDNAWERGRIELLNISPDPTVRHTFWSQVVGGCFVYCSLYAVNQAQVQRLLSLPTLRAGQTALWLQVRAYRLIMIPETEIDFYDKEQGLKVLKMRIKVMNIFWSKMCDNILV